MRGLDSMISPNGGKRSSRSRTHENQASSSDSPLILLLLDHHRTRGSPRCEPSVILGPATARGGSKNDEMRCPKSPPPLLLVGLVKDG